MGKELEEIVFKMKSEGIVTGESLLCLTKQLGEDKWLKSVLSNDSWSEQGKKENPCQKWKGTSSTEITNIGNLPGEEVQWIFGLRYFKYLSWQVSTKQRKLRVVRWSVLQTVGKLGLLVISYLRFIFYVDLTHIFWRVVKNSRLAQTLTSKNRAPCW